MTMKTAGNNIRLLTTYASIDTQKARTFDCYSCGESFQSDNPMETLYELHMCHRCEEEEQADFEYFEATRRD